ncbi:MAG: hypothetical protein RLY21_637 [Planctomycetota bacterium]|jgi:hypothetical protein
MTLHKPTPRIPIPQAAAGCTAFAAFSVSVIVGTAAGNPADVILGRALLAMLCGFAAGFAVGIVCDWLVAQEVARLEAAVEEDTKAIEAERAGRDAPEALEVLDEEALGVIEERGSRMSRNQDSEDSAQREEKSAA